MLLKNLLGAEKFSAENQVPTTSITLKLTIRKNVRTMGTIARFNIVARRLFQ
jgi:hypothetical protein